MGAERGGIVIDMKSKSSDTSKCNGNEYTYENFSVFSIFPFFFVFLEYTY